MSKFYFRGDTIFLYTQFVDATGKPCQAEEPQVRILHDNDGDIYEDLPWTDMQVMSESEYYLNFNVPYISDLGQYQAIYSGKINGEEAYVIETFHIVSKSDKYEDTVKIYGNVHDIRTGITLSDSNIVVINSETGEKISQSLTNEEGYWEAYLYPGVYTFKFSKIDFKNMDINVEIGDEHNEIQFNNVGLESESASSKGNGIFQVGDKYVTKQGTPLNGLNISIAAIENPMITIAADQTNNEGQWNCYLDPGTYILKLVGKSLGTDFNRTFRVKVDDVGGYKFEDISKNTATVSKSTCHDNGTGSKTISDYVKDRHGNPIIDVLVNAFNEGAQLLDSNIIAQDYTDVQGKWTLNLEPGNYIIEFYHPDFKEFTEKKTV